MGLRDSPVSKMLLSEARGPDLEFQTHIKMSGLVHACKLITGEAETGGFLFWLPGKSSLLSKLQAKERPCHKKKCKWYSRR